MTAAFFVDLVNINNYLDGQGCNEYTVTFVLDVLRQTRSGVLWAYHMGQV